MILKIGNEDAQFHFRDLVCSALYCLLRVYCVDNSNITVLYIQRSFTCRSSISEDDDFVYD